MQYVQFVSKEIDDKKLVNSTLLLAVHTMTDRDKRQL